MNIRISSTMKIIKTKIKQQNLYFDRHFLTACLRLILRFCLCSFVNFIFFGFDYISEFSESQVFFGKFRILDCVRKEFKQILEEYLTENGFSQSEFARRMGAKPSLVNDWLRGKAKPGYEALRLMVETFDLPADYLLGLTDEY